MSLVASSTEGDLVHRPTLWRQIAPIVLIFLIVLAGKVAFYFADPYPSFHFGDSGAYLATALVKWIPPDRSFTYGFLLRPLVLHSHSFKPVLAVQIVASGTASVIVGLILLRFFQTKPVVAITVACLSAVEPLQLMSERFVMAEALATFGFAVYLFLSLLFLQSGRIATLIGVQAIGVLLVSLRYSFLPLILLLSIALPLVSFYERRPLHWKGLLIRLAVAVTVCQLSLAGYRHLYGFLAGTKPAYLSRDGEFLVADMAPIIKPIDFPLPGERKRLMGMIRIPLGDPFNRRLHRWVDGGLCQAILKVAGKDEDLANVLARKTALRAMKRDPLGVLRLGLITYGEFLSYKKVEWALQLNQGHFVGPTDNDVKMIRDWFGVNALDRKYDSVTKQWQGMSVPWCWAIVLLPWLYASEMIWHRRRINGSDYVLLLSFVFLLASAILPVEIANPRYLIPLPWLSVLILGVLVCRSAPNQTRSK
jgi:hypothetical protein